jgi:GTPase SAR1 family protein
MFAQYGQIQNELRKDLQALSALARAGGRHDFANALSVVFAKLSEKRFNLAVLGEFKRGKSTLINALLGRPFLPMAVVPLTSVVTVVEYGEALRVEARFNDGRKETIPVETIPAYVTERENPKNEKGVEEVRVTYPAAFLKGGVRLIDTPGVGSVYEHNTRVAMEFLPQADAALFVVSADPPISGAEVAFLKQLRPYVEKLFFILNKTDLLTDSDLREALEFTQATLRDVLGVPFIRLYSISARLALEGKTRPDPSKLSQSRLSEFEKDLEAFFLEEKGRVMLLSTMDRASQIIQQERFVLSLQESVLNAPLGALPEKQVAFKRQKESILKRQAEAHHLLQGEINQLLSILDQDLADFKRGPAQSLSAQLTEFFKASPERGGNLRRRLYDHIQENIQLWFNAWLATEEKKISMDAARMTRLFADRINSVVERLMEVSAGLLGVRFESLNWTETMMLQSGFYYYDIRLESSFLTPLLHLLIDRLPSRFSRRLILQEARRVLSEQIERHCGRLRADFQQRLKGEIDGFQSALDRWVDETAQRIEQAMAIALDQKTRTEAQLTTQIQALREEIGRLDRILIRLRELRRETSDNG